MAIATQSRLMTAEEFLALPEDGIDRWLIDGELREKLPEKPMTYRNRFHSKIMANLSKLVGNWRDQQPEPRGDVLCGEAGVRLTRNPDTIVGIDVVYIAPDVVVRQTEETTIIEGVPLLAAEILSPSDTIEEVREKTAKSLSAGVPLVWIIDPYDRTATVYRANRSPILVPEDQELHDESLPGLRLRVTDLFR